MSNQVTRIAPHLNKEKDYVDVTRRLESLPGRFVVRHAYSCHAGLYHGHPRLWWARSGSWERGTNTWLVSWPAPERKPWGPSGEWNVSIREEM